MGEGGVSEEEGGGEKERWKGPVGGEMTEVRVEQMQKR